MWSLRLAQQLLAQSSLARALPTMSFQPESFCSSREHTDFFKHRRGGRLHRSYRGRVTGSIPRGRKIRMTAPGTKWVRNAVISYAMPGEDWWHVFPSDYIATSVNPNSKARFAIVGANGIGMYYVGETAGVTLWESVLQVGSA